MKVDILNGKGESVSKLPGDRRRLLVELKVIWHGRILARSFLCSFCKFILVRVVDYQWLTVSNNGDDY